MRWKGWVGEGFGMWYLLGEASVDLASRLASLLHG